MKLKNRFPHMRNKSVKVNGTKYDLDNQCIADVSDESDAKKLLKGDAWSLYHPKPLPVPDPEPVAEVAPVPDPTPEPVVEEKTVDGVDGEPDPEPVAEENPEDIDRQYPDPTSDNSVKELKELADVYQVSYKDQPNKSTLIKRIMEAMYPQE